MSATVTLAELRDRVFRAADIAVGEFRSSDDIDQLINTYAGTVRDLLIQISPHDYWTAEVSLLIYDGVSTYPLPADFRSLTGVFDDSNREIPEIRPKQLFRYVAPSGGASVRLEYIPRHDALAGDQDELDVWIPGADELVVAHAAADLLAQQHLDTSYLERKIALVTQRIRAAAPRRYRGPQYVTDVYDEGAAYGDRTDVAATHGSVAGWRMRGPEIELYALRIV